jgi:hypothetical protein
LGCATNEKHLATEVSFMAHLNIDARRAMVGKVLNAGIQIGSREAKVLGVVFNCSQSAIAADVKALHGADSGSPHHLLESGPGR